MLCAAPPVPTLLQGERIGVSQMRLSWEPVLHEFPITNYTVKYYPLSPGTHTQQSPEIFRTTTGTEVVVQDLQPGLRYSVSVAANNAGGRGDYTSEVTVQCKCSSVFAIICSPLLYPLTHDIFAVTEHSGFQLFLSGPIVCDEWRVS